MYACVAPEIVERDSVYRGAWLKDCAIGTPNAEARDESGMLAERLWKTTERQLAAALEKEGLNGEIITIDHSGYSEQPTDKIAAA